MHRAMHCLGSAVHDVRLFPDQPNDIRIRLLDNPALRYSIDRCEKAWRELEEATTEVRVALGEEAGRIIARLRDEVGVFLAMHQMVMIETLGQNVNLVEPNFGWSWRGAFRGDVDDALACVVHFRRMVTTIVTLGERKLGRATGPSPERELTRDEKQALLFNACHPEVVTLWVDAERGRRAKVSGTATA